MEISEFQVRSTRTIPKDLEFKDVAANMCMGIAGEAGEVIDLIKKGLYQGHGYNAESITEEIGDLMFYIVNLCTIFNIDMRNVLQVNVDKLKKRYPDGFEAEKSVNRRG